MGVRHLGTHNTLCSNSITFFEEMLLYLEISLQMPPFSTTFTLFIVFFSLVSALWMFSYFLLVFLSGSSLFYPLVALNTFRIQILCLVGFRYGILLPASHPPLPSSSRITTFLMSKRREEMFMEHGNSTLDWSTLTPLREGFIQPTR